MRRARVLLILLAWCAVWPVSAYAQSDILDWLQPQSGPGPYTNVWHKTGAFDARLWCRPVPDAPKEEEFLRKLRRCWIDNPNDVRWALSFGGEFAYTDSSDGSRLFLDDPADQREVQERRFTTALTYHVNRLFDVGGTVDALRFSSSEGNAFTFWRLGVGPRLSLALGGLWCKVPPARGALARVVRFQVDATYILDGFKASDYGNTVSKFATGKEFQVRSSIVVDGGALIQALWK